MPIRPCEPEFKKIIAGWLASTPADHPYRIAVVSDDKEEARRRFAAAMAAWAELHDRRMAS